MNLEDTKLAVEGFSKKHQIEILKIIKNTSSCTINENKSGVYINLTFLPNETIDLIHKYIYYVRDQETILNPVECQKQSFKNTFFIDKGHKDNVVN
jgi:hypothetical protein